MSIDALDFAATSVVDLIDDTIATRPNEVAVRADDATLTYAELAEQADRLAHELRHSGVNSGDLVGLCVNRSSALVVGALGIIRAGAAFVAIDPDYPDERRRWMLEDSGAAASVIDLATDKRFAHRPSVPQIVLEPGGELADPRAADHSEALPGPPDPDDVAYVVYTSGSTGRPKGVLVEHAGLANLVDWHLTAFGLAPGDRCTPDRQPRFRRLRLGDLAEPRRRRDASRGPGRPQARPDGPARLARRARESPSPSCRPRWPTSSSA